MSYMPGEFQRMLAGMWRDWNARRFCIGVGGEVLHAKEIMGRSGGSKGGAPPPQSKIFSIACSFSENLAKS